VTVFRGVDNPDDPTVSFLWEMRCLDRFHRQAASTLQNLPFFGESSQSGEKQTEHHPHSGGGFMQWQLLSAADMGTMIRAEGRTNLLLRPESRMMV